MKDIIPLKIMIEFKEDGTFNDILLFYKTVLTSGEISKKIYSISIKSTVSIPIINGIIFNSKDLARTQENKGA